MPKTETLARLRTENAALKRELSALREQVAQLSSALAAAQARISELEAKKTPPPAFVKPNAPERPKPPRKKRAPEHNHARRLETPTQIVEHRLERCPTCQGRLSGIHLGRRRQVVDLPPPSPVEVREHQIFRGWCSFCQAWREARLDLHGQVLGQGRIGVGIASLVAHLRLVVRAPIRVIQAWLSSVHRLHLSVGEISDLLRRVAAHGQGAVAQVRERIRASPVVQADETSWRENGPNRVRLVRRDTNRASATSSTTTAGQVLGSTRCWERTSLASWVVISTPATTTPQGDGISGAGRICCAICMHSKPITRPRWK